MMQFEDTFGRKLGCLWVGNLAICAQHFTSLTCSLNKIDLFCLLVVIVKQISLSFFWFVKSHIVSALVNNVILNRRIIRRVYTLVCTRNMVSRLQFSQSWLKLQVHPCIQQNIN